MLVKVGYVYRSPHMVILVITPNGRGHWYVEAMNGGFDLRKGFDLRNMNNHDKDDFKFYDELEELK